jgi:hypothetical protein
VDHNYRRHRPRGDPFTAATIAEAGAADTDV